MATTAEDVRRLFENSPFFQFIGFQVKRFEEGDVILELPVRDELLNVNQTLHGGVYASLLDTVIGLTIRSIVKQPLATINMHIHYFAPVREGKLVAKANVIQHGYRIVSAEGEIADEQGRLLAKGMATFKVLRNQHK